VDGTAVAVLAATAIALVPSSAEPVPLTSIHGGKLTIVGFSPWGSAWTAVQHTPVGLEQGPTSGCYYDADEFPTTITSHGVEFSFDVNDGLVYGIEVDPGTILTLPKPADTVYVAYAAVCWWSHGLPFKPVTLDVWDSRGHERTVRLTLADWCAVDFTPYRPADGFPIVTFDHRIRVTKETIYLPLIFISIPIWTDWNWNFTGPKPSVWAFHLSARELGLHDIAKIGFRYTGGHLYILAVTETRNPGEPLYYDVVGGPGCTDTNLGPAGMDGVGSCYWEGEWPGPITVYVQGIPFQIPPANGPDAIRANGRLVRLPTPAYDVWFLYAATNWNFNGKGYGPLDIVVIDDQGHAVTVRVPLVDWCATVTHVPDNVRVFTFDVRATPGGIQSITCSIWAFHLNAAEVGLPDIAAVYFPDTGRRELWILGATIDGHPVPVTQLTALDVQHPWPGYTTPVFYPGGRTLDGTYELPPTFTVPDDNPLHELQEALDGDHHDEKRVKDGEIIWIPAGDEVVPVELHTKAAPSICTTIHIPPQLHATAVYILYAATDWTTPQHQPLAAVPVTVVYANGDAYTSSIGLLDWCAFDPNAYDAHARKLAAACAVLPQHEAYWTPGEPLAYEIPAMVFPYRITPTGTKDDKRPVLWLLKLVLPPGRTPTALEIGYHPGHLWVLSITVRAADGTYYTLESDGNARPLPKYTQRAQPTVPPAAATDALTDECTVQGYHVRTLWTPISFSIEVKTPTLDIEWPLPALGAMSVTVEVPAGTMTTDDQPNITAFRDARGFDTLGLEDIYASGDAFAGAALLYLYDKLATHIAHDLGLTVYRAEPAYVTVLTEWNADMTEPAKTLEKLGLEAQPPYPDSTFTEYLVYQPTLGLEFYGPPLEARAATAYLSALLPGLEDAILQVARGRNTLPNEINDIDWTRLENALADLYRKIDVPNAAELARETVQELQRLVQTPTPTPRLNTVGTIDEPVLNRYPGLTAVTNIPWAQPTTWTLTFYTYYPVPSKGAAITSDCFHATLSDNLQSLLDEMKEAGKEILHFLLYHASGNMLISLALSFLLSALAPQSVIAQLAAEALAAGLAPVVIATGKGELFNDWSDWNRIKMSASEVASTRPLPFVWVLKYYIVKEGPPFRVKMIYTAVSAAFSYLSSLSTGAQLP